MFCFSYIIAHSLRRPSLLPASFSKMVPNVWGRDMWLPCPVAGGGGGEVSGTSAGTRLHTPWSLSAFGVKSLSVWLLHTQIILGLKSTAGEFIRCFLPWAVILEVSLADSTSSYFSYLSIPHRTMINDRRFQDPVIELSVNTPHCASVLRFSSRYSQQETFCPGLLTFCGFGLLKQD